MYLAYNNSSECDNLAKVENVNWVCNRTVMEGPDTMAQLTLGLFCVKFSVVTPFVSFFRAPQGELSATQLGACK